MIKIEFIFAWYDFWIGVYYDRKNKIIYLFFLPTIGLKILILSK